MDEQSENYVKIKKTELEKIIDRKVKKRLEKEREKKRRRKSKSENRDEQISRRSFLKKLGAGAAGLGAISLLPSVSAFDVKSSDGLEVYDSNNKYFDVNPGGPVEVTNTNLRLPTGQAIEDGEGFERVKLRSDLTRITSESGISNLDDGFIQLVGGSEVSVNAPVGGKYKIKDRDGGFDAVTYTTSSSSPGTLELTNADLDVKGNRIKTDNFEVTENSSTNSLDFNYTR